MLDDLLNAGKFQECDRAFLVANADSMSDLLIVTYLGITLRAKDKLPSRKKFYRQAFKVVKKRRSGLGAVKLLTKYA